MPTTRPGRAGERAAWLGLGITVALVVASMVVPRLADWDVKTRAARSAAEGLVPPLHGYWDPGVGIGTLPALLLALLGWRYAADLATRLPWRRLLAGSYLLSLAWLLSLALVDGPSGISRVLGNPYEYLRTAREVDDVGALLEVYISRIPIDSTDNWPTHVAGHPPAMVLFFVGLVALGLGGDLAAGLVVILIAASIPAAVLVTLRALGTGDGVERSEDLARRAAPFLVLTPAAVFLAVSADAVITAVTAWGIAALALAARATSTRGLLGWSVVSGLLLGTSVLMSYGMPLMGVLAVAVLLCARSWRPLPVAAGAALVVVLGFALAGFAWWEAYPVLRERYYDGIASDRPYAYWVWGNLGALAISAGPLVGAGLGAAVRTRGRVAAYVVGAAAVMVVLADLSGMSKSEVERIWLPFIPWLTVSLALVPQRWLRPALGLQVLFALVVQHLLYTSW